jgi:hypothetical protein
MLAVCELPRGLVGADLLIDRIGYPLAITALAATGLLSIALIGVCWRASL